MGKHVSSKTPIIASNGNGSSGHVVAEELNEEFAKQIALMNISQNTTSRDYLNKTDPYKKKALINKSAMDKTSTSNLGS